jgi:4-amino-4-deoxy-L-arabinose transferase-like glycosyltransferase
LGAAIAAPWHGAMAAHYGQPFLDEYVGRQTIGRARGTSFQSDPWWYYLKLMAGTYWPWAAVLALAAGAWARRGFPARRTGQVLALSWTLLWLVAVSLFADKRRQYILPAYPAMAWLCATWLVGLPCISRAPLLRRGRLDAIVAAGLLVSISITVARSVSVWRNPPDGWPRVVEFLRREGAPEVWAGSIQYNHAGMLAALTGRWPRTIDWSEEYRTPPPAGALVVFAERPAPLGAEEVFRSGTVAVVRWPPGLHDPRDRDAPPPGLHPWFVR